jgi:DNA-binding SARP family transcriptional activator
VAEFRILGPLEVEENGQLLALGGARQRAVLALLLTRPNEVVSVDRLIDDLWGAEPPRTAANTVQYYVSQLRKLLGADRIATRAPGYAIRIAPGELDLQRFEELLGKGETDALREALGLWRGSPLADLAYESFAQAEITRLDEMRLAALEKRIDADLAAGKDAELVGEVEALVDVYPLRERLRGQLMLALYRAGRQADALAAYTAARTALVEELGLEPSSALQELERAMLRHDPSLLVDAAAAAPVIQRSLLVVPSSLAAADTLLSIAEPLARHPARELIVTGLVAPGQDLAAATAALAERREQLSARDVTARVVAYTSDTPGEEAATVAAEQDVDLVLVDAPPGLLDTEELGPDLEAILRAAPCDVGVLVKAETFRGDGSRPVVVPFGGVEHDWAAVEIAAWLARALEAPLRLAGTTEAGDRRDASRLLGRASLVVQAALGIVAEPALVPPGAEGMVDAATNGSLLVVGLSERWQAEGLGEARLALARAVGIPTLLVRHGLRPGGLAPSETMTRFTWTLAGR